MLYKIAHSGELFSLELLQEIKRYAQG